MDRPTPRMARFPGSRYINHIPPGALHVVCGPPGSGRTSLITTWAYKLASSAVPTAVLSAEGTADVIAAQLAAHCGAIPVREALADPDLGEATLEGLALAPVLSTLDYARADDGSARAERYAALLSLEEQAPADAVLKVAFVDGFASIAGPPEGEASGRDRRAAALDAMRHLKSLGQRTNTALVVTTDADPESEALLASDGVGEVADVVTYMEAITIDPLWPLYENSPSVGQPGEVRLHTLRHRYGPRGSDRMALDGQCRTVKPLQVSARNSAERFDAHPALMIKPGDRVVDSGY